MARSNPRLVVGAGVVSAFLLVGGPGLAAGIAEPGHSGRGDRDNSDRNWGGSRGGSNHYDRGERSGGNDWGERRGGGGGDNNRKADNDAPQSRVGSGRTDIQQRSPAAEAPSSQDSSSSDESGSDHPGSPKANFDPPKVTVGNGRSPGERDDDREPRFGYTAPEPAPPPPPPPPPPRAPEPSWADRISTPPVMPKQLSVAPAADWTEPLWGIAGLLLIPAAGAVLGYRQAKAANAVADIGRR